MILLGTVCGVFTKAWNSNFLPVSGEEKMRWWGLVHGGKSAGRVGAGPVV